MPAAAGALAWCGVLGAAAMAVGVPWSPWIVLLAVPLSVVADQLGQIDQSRPTPGESRLSLAGTHAEVVREDGAFVSVIDDTTAAHGVRLIVSSTAARYLPADELEAIAHHRLAFATDGGTALGRAARHGARTAAAAEEMLLLPWRTRATGAIAAIGLLPLLPAVAAGLVLIRWADRAAALLILRPALRTHEARAAMRNGAPPALLLRAAARLDLHDGVPAHRPEWEPTAVGGPSDVDGAFGALAPDFATRHAMLVAHGADTMGGTAMTRPSWLLGTAAGAGRYILVPLAALAGMALLLLAAAGPVWLELQALEAARILGAAARELPRLSPAP